MANEAVPNEAGQAGAPPSLSDGHSSETVRLLEDSPAPEDLFEGQAHHKLANAISELVRSEPGGRVIGLEGTWGSGKSTVVSLVASELESGDDGGATAKDDDANQRVLVFDTWAHQGDRLRRTFLEQLLESLKGSWLSDEEVADHRNKLSGKVSHQKTRTSARLTPEGLVTSAALLLVPLGAALFSNTFHRLHAWLIPLGAMFLVAPLAVMFGYWIRVKSARWRVGRLTKQKKEVPKKLKAVSESPTFRFFAQDQTTDTEVDTVEQGEPTSVEFEERFGCIMSEAVTDSRRLLLVLDNLDRIAEEDARSILATMQTFTGSSRQRAGQAWSRNVWTLIPFDAAGLAKLWDGKVIDPDGGTTVNVPASSTARAFFDKLFEVRFVVPPTVLSDWRAFLLGQLESALPDRSEDELQSVVRLRSLYPSVVPGGRVAQGETTPRQLKQFGNQIGSIVRQRGDIPLTHIAYYVLLERDGDDILDRITKGDGPPSTLAVLLRSDVRSNLAALYFGTSPDLATQLLLREPIHAALASGSTEDLTSLAVQNGWFETLESLDVAPWAGGGGVELSHAVAALFESGLLAEARVSVWYKDIVRPVALGTNEWTLVDHPSGLGLGVMCHEMTEVQVAAMLSKITPLTPETADLEASLRGVAALADAVPAPVKQSGQLKVQCDLSPDQLVPAIAYFGTQTTSAESRAVLAYSASPTEIAGALVTYVATDPATAVNAYRTLGTTPDRIDQSAVASECAAQLASDPNDAALAGYLDLLDIARQEPAGNDVLTALADDGTLMHHLAQAVRSGWRAAADASMLFLTVRPSTTEPPPVREATQGIGILRQVLSDPSSQEHLAQAQSQWLVRHSKNATSWVLRLVTREPAIAPWGDYQLRELHKANRLGLTPQVLKDSWETFDRAFSHEEFDEIVAGLLATSESRTELLADSNDTRFAVRLLRAAAEVDEQAKKEVGTWAGNIVAHAPKEEWLSSLQQEGGGPIVALALSLLDGGVKVSASTSLNDALHNFAKHLEDGGAGWRPPPEVLMALAKLLAAATRKTLASELCAGMEGRDGNIDQSFFVVFGDFLESEAGFRRHPKLPHVIGRLIAHDRWEQVGWFVGVAKRHPDTLQPAERADAIAALKLTVGEKVTALRSAEGAEIPGPLTDLEAELITDAESEPEKIEG